MNVCMFTNTYLPHIGGVARSVATFVKDLRLLGHRVLVVAPRFDENARQESSEEDVLRVPAIQNFNGSDFAVRVPVPFVIDQKISAFNPDVVHSHHPFLLGDTALRAARRRRLPLFFTHHTLYEEYTHYVPGDSKTLAGFVLRLSTEYANLCQHVIAPSQSVARLIEGRGVSVPISVIPTGVDIRFFRGGRGLPFRRSLGIAEDAFVVGHVGRLAPEKNLEYLAESVALFMKAHPEARFLAVGAGASEKEIERIFANEGLDAQLLMAGQQTGQALADAYKAMDLFVFASMTETQGMVLVEAMAAGKPVVALDASGTREVVRDGKNGRLLHAGASPDEFAEAIESFVKDKDMAARWKKEALSTAESFSREASADALLHLYNSVIGKQGNSERKAEHTLASWDVLLDSLNVEWDLIAEKVRAAVGTIRSDKDDVGENAPGSA